MKTRRLFNLSVLLFVFIVVPVFSYYFITSDNNPPKQDIKQDLPPKQERKQDVKKSKKLDLGLTSEKFYNTYQRLVIEYSEPMLSITKERNEGEKTFFYLHSMIGIGLEENENGMVESITVVCEPHKAYNEKKTVERATLSYIVVMRILNPELTHEEVNNIIKKLPYRLKKSSTTYGKFLYESRVYDGILMLSVSAVS